MAELILVKAANPERVALWERHEDHPDNEVFVTGEDAVLVALTPAVQRKLDQGVLLRIEPAADAPTDETPVPFEGYDSLTVAQVLERKAELSAAEWDIVREYEQAHKNRKGIVETTE